MKIAVAFGPGPGAALELSLDLPATATAIDAVRASGLAGRFPEEGIDALTIGIWGRACAPDTRLREGDRVEVYRPLAMDPNEARRLRARQTRDRKRA